MRRAIMAAILFAGLAFQGRAAEADPQEEIRDLYERFVAAQNMADVATVRSLLWDSPDFLWITDGRSVWTADAMIARMTDFQRADVWIVEPEREASKVVLLGKDVAYLHMPLVLVIGRADAPARLPWLVEVLCRRGPEGWRIAGLFTTQDKRR